MLDMLHFLMLSSIDAALTSIYVIQVNRSTGRLVDRLTGHLVDRSSGRLVDRLIGRLVDRLIG